MDDFDDILEHIFGDSNDGLLDLSSIDSIDDLGPFADGLESDLPTDVDFGNAMDNALFDFQQGSQSYSGIDNISFEGHNHHEPFEGEYGYSSEPSFTGDKYTDDAWNRKQADHWFDVEKDCYAKGDTSGAQAAHSTAMKHMNRIKK